MFDCGACCGLDAILFSRECKKVYCLEPDSKNFELLTQNTKEYPNITIIHKALFNHCGEIEFSCENAQGSMILGKSIDGLSVEELKKLRKAESIVVQCTTLDEMMKEFGKPDIIKLDIEGAEYDLVYNNCMKNVLESGPVLVFEIHGSTSTVQFNTLVKYIESFGYTITHHNNHLLGYHIVCNPH